MSDNNPVTSMMAEVMKNMKGMIDVNTVIGDPVTSADGTIIIPISRVTFGFGGGGGESAVKGEDGKFNGGIGGGASVKAEAFLVISSSNVRIIPMSQDSSPVSKLVDMIPDALEKVNSFIAGRKKGNTSDDNIAG